MAPQLPDSDKPLVLSRSASERRDQVWRQKEDPSILRRGAHPSSAYIAVGSEDKLEPETPSTGRESRGGLRTANVAGNWLPRSGGGRGRLTSMNDVTRILSAIEQGDPQAAEQLLPLVYDELRQLAAQRLAQEKPGPDAPGHGPGPRGLPAAGRHAKQAQHWDGRGHFFAAAAEAMRRILVDNARRKRSRKRRRRAPAASTWTIAADVAEAAADDLLALDEALAGARRGRTRPRPSWSSSATSPACRSRRPPRLLGISRRNGRPPLGLRPGLAATARSTAPTPPDAGLKNLPRSVRRSGADSRIA